MQTDVTVIDSNDHNAENELRITKDKIDFQSFILTLNGFNRSKVTKENNGLCNIYTDA